MQFNIETTFRIDEVNAFASPGEQSLGHLMVATNPRLRHLSVPVPVLSVPNALRSDLSVCKEKLCMKFASFYSCMFKIGISKNWFKNT